MRARVFEKKNAKILNWSQFLRESVQNTLQLHARVTADMVTMFKIAG